MNDRPDVPEHPAWKETLYEIIFEADTRAGKTFDVALIATILASVLVVMMDSVASLREEYSNIFKLLEWVFTGLFTIEYILRLVSVKRPLKYAFSFFGVVDFLAILPTYLSLFSPVMHYLLVIRILRILRIFRVFKLAHYIGEAGILIRALRSSGRKITVFLFTVLTLVVVFGSLLYIIEGEQNGFTSIPKSIYWAIVTLTTVGYGDISPQTSLGQTVAAFIMIMGYSIIAVPTGVVTVELSRLSGMYTRGGKCPACGAKSHDADAKHCKYCGSGLDKKA
jgi:voltage-gated potassium channel